MVISFGVCEIHSQVVVEVAVGAEPAHDVQVPPDSKALPRYKYMALVSYVVYVNTGISFHIMF